ncbi:MAG: YHS domain-containing protein [Clostridiales bacterium]|nr:YHS domain-containing protein [Clostridiales bacterium]
MSSGFFRFIVYLFITYLIILVLRFFLSARRKGQRSRPPRQLSGVMVKDEMCNTYLPEENALKEKLDGKEYYFCSRECRERFIELRKSQKGDSSL